MWRHCPADIDGVVFSLCICLHLLLIGTAANDLAEASTCRWITGEPNVGFVVFVRKRLVEVQYLHATITQEQRDGFGAMLANTIRQIEAAQFPARSGIRFPQNGCLSCSHLGLCLGKQDLIDAQLVRRPGGDLGWLHQLDY